MFEYSFRVIGLCYDETLIVTASSVADADRQARDWFPAESYSRTLLGSRDLEPQKFLAW